ncbi:DNA polymerase domain-containing protein [Klenkia taihuensis]|uniref:DNA ligase D, polymerase domain-containing protein n=1 Tax=Klenkia taihuensis TaxID=1225127 RepID=A0A1I1S0U6_9ACTN|nr:ATP-dependent DNA ligase [Klenkia taihuensis]GHE13771.1 ATP-dependent DNA ligase [Klenkia taihuensis]SFD40139.1 DNA ligase D, polymerase domain-containing protein [Klenkia taihuensis]
MDEVRFSSLDDELGDGLGVTKRALVEHYDAFADRLVPLLSGRPLTMVRIRPGAAAFVQRDIPKGAPDWVRTVATWSDRTRREVHQVLVEDRRTLLWLANQRAVELHVPFSPVVDGAFAEPTGLVLDLDPPEDGDFAQVVAVARLAREALAAAGLAGAVKTSGSSGLHVVVPVCGSSHEDVAAATRALAARTAALDPAVATTEYVVADRGGRVFVDSTRSGRGTIAAAYSPRARPGLPISAPVAWDDLDGVTPRGVTVADAAARITGDPWADSMPAPQELPADLVAEGHTIPVARVAAMHEGKRRRKAAEG